MVHLPNESINTPQVDWTSVEEGAGVPTETPDAEDVAEQLAADDDTEDTTEVAFDPADYSDEPDFDLEIERDSGYDVGANGQDGDGVSADGTGLETDTVLSSDAYTGPEQDPNRPQDQPETDSQPGQSLSDDNGSEPSPDQTTTGEAATPNPEDGTNTATDTGADTDSDADGDSGAGTSAGETRPDFLDESPDPEDVWGNGRQDEDGSDEEEQRE